MKLYAPPQPAYNLNPAAANYARRRRIQPQTTARYAPPGHNHETPATANPNS